MCCVLNVWNVMQLLLYGVRDGIRAKTPSQADLHPLNIVGYADAAIDCSPEKCKWKSSSDTIQACLFFLLFATCQPFSEILQKAAKMQVCEAEAVQDFLKISHCTGCNADLINGVYDSSGLNVSSSVRICTSAIQYDPVTKQKHVASWEDSTIFFVSSEHGAGFDIEEVYMMVSVNGTFTKGAEGWEAQDVQMEHHTKTH